MIRRSALWLRLGEWLLKRRWWLVASASLLVFFFEFLEYELYRRGITVRFFYEVLFYGILLPVSTGLALSGLAVSRSELAWSTYYQNLKRNLDRQLYSAASHEELGQVFMQFVRVVMPLSHAALFRYDQQVNDYKVIANWALQRNSPFADAAIQCTAVQCPLLTMQPGVDGMGLQPCQALHLNPPGRHSVYFCTPFFFSMERVGAARLQFASTNAPSPEQDRLLKEIAPVIASVFQRIDLEHRMKKRNESITSEQERIARDVHDSLGHSLAYLRLRLDHMSMEFNQTQMNIMQQDVEALRDVAKEAYDQMRDVLNSLSPPGGFNISDTLTNFAERISQRSNFKVHTHQYGKPHVLPSLIQRNIFYIFQEALTNIEKHAHAYQVDVNLKWQQSEFVMEIIDNGVGYDPAQQIPDGHFGLNNMRQRALESHAELLISSQPGHGTHLSFCIPYEEQL